MVSLNKEKIQLPEITLNAKAVKNLSTLITNDPYFELGYRCLRLFVAEKNCDGMLFQLGIDRPRENDLIVTAEDIPFHLDPFTAFYFPKGHIHGLTRSDNQEDVMIVQLTDERMGEKTKGKFWKEELAPIPPLMKKNEEENPSTL